MIASETRVRQGAARRRASMARRNIGTRLYRCGVWRGGGRSASWGADKAVREVGAGEGEGWRGRGSVSGALIVLRSDLWWEEHGERQIWC